MNKILLRTFMLLSFISNAQTDSPLCSKIQRSVDEMTDKITLMTPSEEAIPPIKLAKVISKKDTLYLFRLRTIGNTLNIGETSVIILFSDGTKMTKQTKIGTDLNEDNTWLYKANITLTSEELNIISTKTIKKFRLFIYDQDVKEQEATDFKAYVNCIIKAK